MIYRIDVRLRGDAGGKPSSGNGGDPLGESVRKQIAELGTDLGPIQSRRIFLIDSDVSAGDARRIADELLADPVVESADLLDSESADSPVSRIEIHLKPGVMDPVAASTESAIRDLGLAVRAVRTGRAYLIPGAVRREELQRIASRVLANGVIESVHFDRYLPARFETGREERFELRRVGLRELTDAQLTKLSRDGHLFLSLAEMRAIQSYFRGQDREPTDIELETLAQTWSEHCVHKTLKSAVDVEERDAAGNVLSSRRYANLIKETIFASTVRLMSAPAGADRPSPPPGFCLSVFADNAGVIAFDDDDAVCFKVETHNHPSAIEPYGGSATGIGGVIRDILGTGLGARPIANSDIFCVAYPQRPAGDLPRGVIHPKRVLQQIVAGVRDYGNRMGIPTINGAVYFDDRYLGNPLVFCGCVGMIPRGQIHKAARAGDAVVVMGGRTGRDGIHGATFSSAELTDTHADEFSHAVQIGNAITEKKTADVILAARDRGLFTAITDCGAGGLSSAVGEMGEKIGARIQLDRVPLKYAGLRYDEIWISEAQERMVLSVPPGRLDALLSLAAEEDVEATVIGTFGTDGAELILDYRGQVVGQMGMEFLHHGIPTPTRKAIVTAGATAGAPAAPPHPSGGPSPREKLLTLLAHPNIASKHWIIRQYDHEVQGGSVIKPLVGPQQIGPSDAAVVRPKLSTHRGIAIGCGMSPQVADPYEMALRSIDEAIRNVVAVGADPARIAVLDNFCWPSVDDERTMGTLVRACEACRDAALAYGIPFISGKDSLHNQFTNQETGEVLRIPNTLLISAIGIVEDVRRCVTMDLKSAGSRIFAAHQRERGPDVGKGLAGLRALHHAVADAIGAGEVLSCHDSSDGGVAVAAAEMCIASGKGMTFHPPGWDAFEEIAGACYLLEVGPARAAAVQARFDRAGVALTACGETLAEPVFQLDGVAVAVGELTRHWRGTLDW